MEMSALVKAELAATCTTLGRLHGGKYVIDPQCYESVRDIIRYLRRDEAYHEVRLYLGAAKILETDLVPIVAMAEPNPELFDIVIRLLVNLTNPVMLLYKEEVPAEKVGRNIYLRLLGHSQEYKSAFCNVEFWKAISVKLTSLFEVDWTDRSEDSSLQIERLLVLLRNVLQVPADVDLEKRPDNDITVHDKVLWALRESQLLELLLYVSSNKDEEQYFLHLLEIFSLILREQSPGMLANCEIRRSGVEKEKDTKELASIREKEKLNSKSFKNTRTFNQTFVLKNVKSISENEMVYHKSLDKMTNLRLTQDKKRMKTPKNKFPEDSERIERRSTFSVRLFLKEFCVELLSCSFNSIMSVVKAKLVSGRGLSNDESYYFWALRFFLEFSCNANVDIKLISECINVQTFHFVQTQLENCYDHMQTEKKKLTTWVRRIHLTLKAYRSLLQTLMWMDGSKDPKIRETSKVIKSNVFYVVEYRELMLNCLHRYDGGKFPLSFLRDLIETNHLNLKLLESFCKNSKIVIQKKKRVKKCVSKKAHKEVPVSVQKTPEDKWTDVKDEVLELLEKNCDIPEVPPFDAASSVPIDEQKEDAMKNVQRHLRNAEIAKAIGLLRSARQVWPENDFFGAQGMSPEEESKALEEICLTDLGVFYEEPRMDVEEEEESEEDDGDEVMEVEEQNFDIQDYIKKLAHKKVVEACCTLLANYKRNTANTNHAVVKLLHRIGWECKVPAMLYQASFFITLHKILDEKNPEYKEAQQLAKQLIKKFRENVSKNPKIFMELLFWKDPKNAIDIQEGYGTSELKPGKGVWSEEEEDELRRLWVEFDEKMYDGDKVDWIKGNLINQNRSRISVIKRLKALFLMMPGEKPSKKKRGGAEWSEEETGQLAQLYEDHKDAVDPVQLIRDRLTLARSKKSIKDKLVEMGLVSNLAELRKKRGGKGKSQAIGARESDESSDDDVEEVEMVQPFSEEFAVNALKSVQSLKEELKWVKETFEECLEDEEAAEGYPLLALDATHSDALDNQDFLDLLRKLGLQEPKADQVYWKIPKVSKMDLHDRLELIKAAIEDKLDEIVVKTTRERRISEDSGSEDEFEKLKRFIPGKEKPNALQSSSEYEEPPKKTQSSQQSRSSRRSDSEGGGSPKKSQASRSSRNSSRSSSRSDSSDDGSPKRSQSSRRSGSKSVRSPKTSQVSRSSRRSDSSDDGSPKRSQSSRRSGSKANRSPKTSQVSRSSRRSDSSDEGSPKRSQSSRRSGSKANRSHKTSQVSRSSRRSDSSDEGSTKRSQSSRRSDSKGEGSPKKSQSGSQDKQERSTRPQSPHRSELGSDDETYKRTSQPADTKPQHPLDSDRSDNGGASDDNEMPKSSKSKKKSRRPGLMGSDSDGEETSPPDYWRFKRRRCIGSDSEMENNPSDDDERGGVVEVRKKSKRMFGSDSEVEDQGSNDDIRMSR